MRTMQMVADTLHDETRARWSAHSPEEFIGTVMHGALRHKLDMTSIVIHVYAQIVYQFSNAALVISSSDGGETPPLSLRDLFTNMRTTVAEAQTTVHNKLNVAPTANSAEWYIVHVTNELRHYMRSIERLALMIESDPRMESMRLPGAKGKSFEDVALDILKHIGEVLQVLDFAQAYIDKRQ
jgi:hypothetical protein